MIFREFIDKLYAAGWRADCDAQHDNALKLWEEMLTFNKAPVAEVACGDGLDSFAQALTFILNEAEAKPGDSLRDITNEALIKYNISLVCGKDHKLLPFDWES